MGNNRQKYHKKIKRLEDKQEATDTSITRKDGALRAIGFSLCMAGFLTLWVYDKVAQYMLWPNNPYLGWAQGIVTFFFFVMGLILLILGAI